MSLNHLPTKQWYVPKGWAYSDFFLNNEEYARLEEGREEYETKGIRFAVVAYEKGFLCSSQPGKEKKRKEAPDVRESMEYLLALTNMVETAVIWSKYKVYLYLDISADPKTIAKELFDHDCITLTHLRGFNGFLAII